MTPPVPDLTLRPVHPDDLPAIFEYQLDPVANEMAAVVARDRTSFDALWRGVFADPTVTARAILADGVLVGQITCFSLGDRDGVGYWIVREHWGRGFASRALALLLKEVTKRPLHASAARSNAGSIRVLERCGFQFQGYEHAPATERYLACEEASFVLR